MGIQLSQSNFGSLPDGRTVTKTEMVNDEGTRVTLMDFGATLQSLQTVDKDGYFSDITLGFDSLDPYFSTRHPYFGSTVGRVAGRIAYSNFELDGKLREVSPNTPPHHLHGGHEGFDRKLWESQLLEDGIRYKLVSLDGDQGYPGTVTVTSSYRLVEGNVLRLDYEATTDAPTVLNLTNHTYFNLKGEGTILDHEMLAESDTYAEVTPEILPTGHFLPVDGTPFDFRIPTAIGERIHLVAGEPIGYDHAFKLKEDNSQEPTLACVVYEKSSGRFIEAWTTDICLQFYTGNFLDGSIVGKGGRNYPQYAGFCLECQHFPGSANRPEFPTIILRPGETYRQTTLYKFGVR